jgi:signal transduction histidine kinase
MSTTQPSDEESEPRDRRVSAILDITEVLCGKTEYTEVVASALEASLDTVDAESGSILLHSPASDTLVFEYVVGPIAGQLLGQSMPVTKGIAGRVFRTGMASLDNDVVHEKEHYRRIPDETGYRSLTMITVPLRTLGGRTLGALQAINKRHGTFRQEDLELLTIVAIQAATIIENARLHKSARLGAVARLLANVGHDVKNMIAPVVTSAAALEALLNRHFAQLEAAATGAGGELSAAELAQQAGQTKQHCFEAIEILARSADRVRERTRQMADCIRGNMTPPQMADTPITEVAREVVDVLSPCAAEEGVSLEFEEAGTCPAVWADGSRIFNAVYNLVMNAIPETPSGGHIGVRVSAEPQGDYPEGGWVRIEVSDTGNGIPPDVLNKLFTGEVVSTKSGGMGLGTRIVKEVADIHGGRVSATSEVGKGSCFALTLPLGRPAERRQTAADSTGWAP